MVEARFEDIYRVYPLDSSKVPTKYLEKNGEIVEAKSTTHEDILDATLEERVELVEGLLNVLEREYNLEITLSAESRVPGLFLAKPKIVNKENLKTSIKNMNPQTITIDFRIIDEVDEIVKNGEGVLLDKYFLDKIFGMRAYNRENRRDGLLRCGKELASIGFITKNGPVFYKSNKGSAICGMRIYGDGIENLDQYKNITAFLDNEETKRETS